MMGVLCAVEIINGVGEAFNIEETEFFHALYQVITTMAGKEPMVEDYLALIKALHILFIRKKQFSNDLIAAFVKKLAYTCITMPFEVQAGVLLFIKQLLNKTPSMISLLEID